MKKSIILTIITFLIYFTEVYSLKGLPSNMDGSLYLSTFIFPPTFFLLISKINFNLNTTFFRSYSSGIYFAHGFLCALFKLIFVKQQYLLIGLWYFAAILLLSIITVWILSIIKNDFVKKIL